MRLHVFLRRVIFCNRALLARCISQKSKLKNDEHQKRESSDEQRTHFGFESVSEGEKEERVYEVFHNVAEKYDLMNDAMSVGIHRLWKDYFVHKLSPIAGTKIIDVAGGTGDIAFRILQYINTQEKSAATHHSDYDIHLPKEIKEKLHMDPVNTSDSSESSSEEEPVRTEKSESHITVCDINQAMLEVGKKKAEKVGYNTGLSWLQGNAENLPIAENTFDCYTIAFGIRNCTHIDKVLSEAYRVVKPGGRFMCLEFSQMPNPLFRRLYDTYSFQVIPVLGQVLAGDWKSYQYLVESIRQFPDQKTFASMIRQSGFKMVTYEDLSLGIAAIHSGFKI